MKEETYPSYICPKCGKKSKLTFHPKVSINKWINLKCPYCGHYRAEDNLRKNNKYDS